jgi:hypothetical protein
VDKRRKRGKRQPEPKTSSDGQMLPVCFPNSGRVPSEKVQGLVVASGGFGHDGFLCVEMSLGK